VKSASFFRTHPPFFERIVSTFSEITFLPPKKDMKVDSTEFHQIKDRFQKIDKETKQERRNRPTLRGGGAPKRSRARIAACRKTVPSQSSVIKPQPSFASPWRVVDELAISP
jgi:hypothetical protein